mgnify:FL=1
MYTPLYVKTDYSLLSSLIKIDELVECLKKKNISSCAVVDDNLYGTMEVIHKFNKAGIKPIIGLDLKEILLYAKTSEGYYNLVKIETLKNKDELSQESLIKYSNDLILICFNKETYDMYKDSFTDIFIGIKNKKEEELYKEEETVYINKTLYLEKALYKYLPYIFMIRDGKTISDKIEFIYQDNYILTSDEVMQKVSSKSINNTLKIESMCNISFKKELFMPKYDTEDSKEFLKNLSNKGLYKRLNGNITETYQKRLNYELDIILKMHFEDYFLVVYDYIKYAKQNGILVGPGRGSAAGSLVSYCLGITDVDPIKYNLLFERFLNPERVTMPDIDTDFPDTRREEVIEYVKEKYGKDNVAGIITFGTLGGRASVRDVGRILNIPTKYIDIICKKIPFKGTLKELKHSDKEVNTMIENDDKLKLLYNIVNLIEGNKRHTSIHAAGIVISYKPLYEIIPIKPNDDINLTEYTMEYLEELGLIKMDFLGIKNLSIIDGVIKDIERKTNKKLDFNKIPFDDPKVMKLFEEGQTSGIFQFESEGMKRFLKDLKPKNFIDLCNAIALFRPGPASNIPSFIKRKEGKEKIEYLDESLKDILKETYGIIIYQEQIMLIAQKFAGYTLSEADILRRAMSKKKYDVLKNEEARFIEKSLKNGKSKEIARELFDLILAFAGYGFNKSHSVSYSIVAYKMAYLKYYFPKEFYANLLSSVIGSEEKTKEYLNEIKKLGIKILPPDINLSNDTRFTFKENAIVFPLNAIRNVGGVISSYIIKQRETPYKDIYDYLKRTHQKTNNKKILESLIYAHVFDSFYNINTLISNLDNILNYVELSSGLDDDILVKPEIELKPELSTEDILNKEKEIFGFYLTSHKTEKFKLNNPNITDIYDIKNKLNQRINVIVSIDKIREIITKKNEVMCFITGSDNTGTTTLIVFPELYKTKNNFKKNEIVKVSGKVERRFNEYQIICNDIEK